MTKDGESEEAYYNAVEEAMHSAALELLKVERSVDCLLKLADLAAESTDRLVDEMVVHHPPLLPVQCAVECPWCCYLVVETTPPEAVRVVAHLRESRTTEEMVAVRARTAELDDRIRGMDRDRRAEARLPCSLLAGGRCSVHSHRPLKCRGGNSADAVLCHENFERVEDMPLPVYLPQLYIADHIQRGIGSALSAAGLVSRRLELVATLRILLDDPDAVLRWLSGEDAIAPARIPE